MSASLCGNMRGPEVKTTLLLLLLLTRLTGTVSSEDDGLPDEEFTEDGTTVPPSITTLSPGHVVTTHPVSDRGEESSGNSETTYAGKDPRRIAYPESPPADGARDIGEDPASSVAPEPEGSTEAPDEDDGSSLIIVIVAVLGAGLITAIVGGILFYRLRNKKAINQELSKEDPYLEGSSTEKVPMPMFEDDVPSVQELEMEELDQWMKKDDSSPAS